MLDELNQRIGEVLRKLDDAEQVEKSEVMVFPNRESDISYRVYRFDPAYATCYKCPFCAGKPGIAI